MRWKQAAVALVGAVVGTGIVGGFIEFEPSRIGGLRIPLIGLGPDIEDRVPPTVTLTAPEAGAALSGTVTLGAEAGDEFAIEGVRFLLNGVELGAEDTASPYSLVWDTTTAPDGTHLLTARVRDDAGNTATSSAVVVVDNGAPGAAVEGPGGPILVVTAFSNGFSRYLTEILRAEGFNAYSVADVAFVDAALLSAHDVVLLGEVPLAPVQAAMLGDWVEGGGKLIAMRPDMELADLLGLERMPDTLSDAYLRIDTAHGPGAGLVDETIQFHGAADLYSAPEARVVASLYATATAETESPAVTLRRVGRNGGEAAAFAYDLARSVVLTRQGNPDWSHQDRDGFRPIRSNDLFYGDADFDPQPDWVNLDKVAIPQADEQQRLLANLILAMTRDRQPLPRLWYLPRGARVAVVLTGDDHASGGTVGRFAQHRAASPTGCSVADWECVRSTSYVFPDTPISDADVARAVADGFEVAVHVSTKCANWAPATLAVFFAKDIEAARRAYPSMPAPTTNRTHCIVWSDYVSQAIVSRMNGIRLDTNYYYWPEKWVGDRPGFFTGSGLPMRFATPHGDPIDVYQAATQLTDESGQSFPYTIDTLLDRAIGPEGYFGVFTANMHTDTAEHDGDDAIVRSARARGVPVVSARQMLEWLDARGETAVSASGWDGMTLGLDLTVPDGARGLEVLVPLDAADGRLESIRRDGETTVEFRVETVKGVAYAVFDGLTGSYALNYAPLRAY